MLKYDVRSPARGAGPYLSSKHGWLRLYIIPGGKREASTTLSCNLCLVQSRFLKTDSAMRVVKLWSELRQLLKVEKSRYVSTFLNPRLESPRQICMTSYHHKL